MRLFRLRGERLDGEKARAAIQYRVPSAIISLSLFLSLMCSAENAANTMENMWAMKSKMLAEIPEGISETEVIELLGKPDEVRVPQSPFLPGSFKTSSAYVWAYGVEGGQGTFARIGLVGFDEDRKVTHAISPIFPPVFLISGVNTIPLTKEPTRTSSGVYCYLEPGEYDQNGALLIVKVSLINEGTEVFRLKHDHTGITHGGVFEIYDRKKVLMLREDRRSLHSLYTTRDEWPVMTIVPGERKTEAFGFWYALQKYGKPLPGEYYVRYLFPLEPESDVVEQEFTAQARITLNNFSSVFPVRIPVIRQKLFPSNFVKFSYTYPE